MFRLNRDVRVDVRFSISDQHERLVINIFGRSYTDEDWKFLSAVDANKQREEMISKAEKQISLIGSFGKVDETATSVSELRRSDVTGNCYITATVAPVIVNEETGEITADVSLIEEIHSELKQKMVKVTQLKPLENDGVVEQSANAQLAD